ncbi:MULTISPECIES: TetR/AcrR family transcriptional regulator [Streptomyces]|uniref:HTH tetR-type domain-containing protein n=1 Tax=Streptomyces cacaoi TaxID=1898 RepID=A0A4Y3QYT2_STRCI|nr:MULTISPECIES: TetR/AcrR family transcriptional regulator [Streptomyces]NNG86406.1 TetR/AcrR family transcriptional regulator [Streptomyces cacaoi]QHF96994.1 TetR/AcrR family transcriptional regulator [Streptomyces sp. NHF165]GEB50564.1 hypothetical protein SCA03_31150 [Streptomyces cacaoi]
MVSSTPSPSGSRTSARTPRTADPAPGTARPRTGTRPRKTAGPERRAELLATAAETFAEQGYNATTVRTIADRAGLLAGSLYYHFDSKEAMADEILSAFLDDLWAGYGRIEEAALPPRETFENLVAESFTQLERHRPAVVLYQKEARHLAAHARFGYLTDAQQRFRALWTGTLERGVADGSFRPDLDVPVAYRFVRDTVWVAAVWFRPQGRLTAPQIARHYSAMVLDGIGSHPSPAGPEQDPR